MSDTFPKPLLVLSDDNEGGEETHHTENASVASAGTVPAEDSSETKASEASETTPEESQVMSEVSLVTAITCTDEEVDIIIEGDDDGDTTEYVIDDVVEDDDDDDDGNNEKCNEPTKDEDAENKSQAWKSIPNYILTEERVMKDVKTPDVNNNHIYMHTIQYNHT